ncbi:DUF1707 SHOCT-like domain-containing protein [Saccharothrix coeruleofusca]|uniref:DUF1707 domain-containing protein n=1 Tax=Saccharothrix coeruleofusca TaxID=33919 RepID=A0A918AKK0_9PSEU|nr:hypothetical protein GCM10010185_07770 [Saccharothrix coeruleofusca]
MEGPAVDPKDLRVSDAEREHVVGLLQKAIGRGLITLDEFTERTDTALASRTRGELNSVLLDLPGVVHGDQAAGPSVAPRERTELKTTMSSVSRKGRWSVPRSLVVRNRMGTTALDFRDADIPHPVVDVELDVAGGMVQLVLPEGATVDADEVEATMGSVVTDKLGTGVGGSPHFVVRGSVRAGSLEIRTKKQRFGFRRA